MTTYPECDAEIEVDEFDIDKGNLISCPDCGSNLEVTTTSPVKLEAVDEDEDKNDNDKKKNDDKNDKDKVDNLDDDDDDVTDKDDK